MNKTYIYKDGLIAFAFGTLAYIAWQVILSFALSVFEAGSVWYWIILALCNVAIGVFAFLYAKLSKRDFVTAASVKVAPHWAHVLWGILITLGLMHAMIPLNNWICDLLELMGLNRPSVDLPMQIAPLIIVASIIPAVSEELLFRGTIANALSHGTTPYWKGVLISGALFSLFHMNPAQTLHQFALGCLLAVLVYRSGSVWTAAIVHLFNNVTSVLLTFFVEETGFYVNYAIWIFLVGIVVSAIAFVGYIRTTKVNTNTAYFEQDESENAVNGDDTVQETQLNGKIVLFKNGMAVFVVAIVICVIFWLTSLFG